MKCSHTGKPFWVFLEEITVSTVHLSVLREGHMRLGTDFTPNSFSAWFSAVS